MDNLEPLSFSVGIKDNTKKKLDEIERRLNAIKENITIKVDGGIDKELSENINAATTAFKELKKAVGTGTPLNTLYKKSEKATEAIDKLAASLKRLGSSITGSEELNQFVSGIGNIIRAVNADFRGFAKEAKTAAASANKAEIEIAKLEMLQKRMRETSAAAQKVGLDTSDLDKAIQKIETIKTELRSIKAGGGVSASGLTTSKYMGTADVQLTIMGAKQDMSVLGAKTRELERLEVEARRANERLENMKKTTDDLKNGFSSLVPSLGSFKRALAGIGGIYVFQKLASDIVRVRGEMEQMEVTITSLVGSQSKAAELIKDLKAFARMSPLTIKDLMDATQTMIGFGVEVEKIPRFIRALGDVTLGNSERFKAVALAFSQMTAAGRLMGQDNLQFINAGFNPLMYIAEKTGKTMKELRDEMQKGAITTKMVEDAFISATEAGGKFYQMSEKTSQTVAGQMNKLSDSIYRSLNDFGEKHEGLIMDSIKGATYLIDNYEQVGRVLVGLIASYGTYRTAVMLATAAENGHTLAMSIARLRILATQKAQTLLNATMLTNPYVAAATALGVLIGTLYATSDGMSATERAQKNFNAAMEEATEKQKEYNQETENAIATASSDATATDQRREAMNLLISRYPSIIQKYIDEKGHLKDILELKKEIAVIDGNKALEDLNRKTQRYRDAADITRRVIHGGQSLTPEEVALYNQVKQEYFDANNWQAKAFYNNNDLLAWTTSMSGDYGKKARRQAAENATSRFQDSIAEMTDAQLSKLQETLKRAKDKKKNVLINGYKELQNVTLSPDDISNLITYTGGIVNARRGSVRDKQKIDEEKKAAQAELDALSVAEATGKKGVELRKKIAGYNKELEAYSASKSAKSEAKEEAAGVRAGEAAERLTGEKLKQALAAERARIDMVHSTTAAEIGAMEDGTRKTLAQIELDREKKLEAIRREYEDIKIKRIEDAKKLWDADPKNKGVNFYLSEEYKTAASDSQYTEAQKANREARIREAMEIEKRAIYDLQRIELQSLYDYLKAYGTIEQQKYAITKEYDDKIAKEHDATRRKQLEADKRSQIAQLDARYLASNIDWRQTFSGIGNVLEGIAKETLQKVDDYMKTADFKNLAASDKNSYRELRKQLVEAGGVNASSPFSKSVWNEIATLVESYRKSVKELNDANDRAKDIRERLTKAEEEAAKDPKNATKQSTVQDLKDQFDEVSAIVQEAQEKTAETQDKLSEKTEQLSRGFQNFDTVLSQITSGTLTGFVLAIGNLIKKFSGDTGDAAKNFGDLFGEAGKQIGGLIGAILQIIDLLGTEPAKFIEDLLNKIADVIEAVLSQLPQIISSVIGGVGNIIGGLFKGVGNLLTGGLAFGSNVEEMEKEISELANSNEALAKSIDSLAKTISDNDSTNIESEEAYGRALAAEKEWQQNQRKAIENRASEWSNGGHGFLGLGGKSSFNYFLNQDFNGWDDFNNVLKQFGYNTKVKTAGDIWQLTPEQMQLLRDYAPKAWSDLLNTDGESNPSDLLDAYIERAGKIDELTDALNKKLTGYDWGSFKGSYVDMLKNLDSTNLDFANNLEDMLTNAILNSLVNEVYKDRIKALYKMIADAASEDSEGGTSMTKSELDAIRAFNDVLAADMIRDRDALVGAGLIKNTSKSGKSLSASVQGIKEETADVLAGYFNAERQDVAFIRLLLGEYLPKLAAGNIGGIESVGLTPSESNANKDGYLSGIVSQLGSMGINAQIYHQEMLNQMAVVTPQISEIAQHTKSIMETNSLIREMMEKGSGKLYEKVAAIDDRFRGMTDGIYTVKIE